MTPSEILQPEMASVMVIPAAGYYCRPTLPSVSIGKYVDDADTFVDDDKSLAYSSKILVMEADDLLRIRSRVCALYPDKRVIVAPCRSKLYLSRQSRVIDSVGTTSPDWSYFATGAIALIYTASSDDLCVALFDSSSTRLLWCLKWSSYICFDAPTANFHVLNTQADKSEHVGIWYENKNVAELMMNAVRLLTEESASQGMSKDCKRRISEDCTAQRRKSILHSLSLKNLRASKEVRSGHENAQCENDLYMPKRKERLGNIGRRKTVEDLIRLSPPGCRRPVLREVGRSRTVIESQDSYVVSFESDGVPKCKKTLPAQIEESLEESREAVNSSALTPEDDSEAKVLTKLTRPGSFIVHSRKSAESGGNMTSNELQTHPDVAAADCNKSDGSNAGSRVRHLFQFGRRLSRSQSLKLPSSGRDSNAESNDENSNEKSRYQRSTKLQKPRAGTDTLLLQGLTVKCVMDTGLMARYVRERKRWGDRLKNGVVESTDLCVTEL